jgi:predicted SnoaL-like aldol condensation-catalyzing enzyme
MTLSPIEVVQRFQQGLNAHDLTVIDRYVAPVYHTHGDGAPEDKSAWKASILEEINAFQEISDSIDDIYIDGDLVYMQTTEVFRQIKPFMGEPPNFKIYTTTIVFPYRVVNGLITDMYPATILKSEIIG